MSDDEPRTRPGGRAARVRSAVHEATRAVIRERGPEQLSIGEVAARAGVHETSVYRRWRTKENLIADTLLASSSEHVPVPDTGSIRTDLIAFARSVASYLSTPLSIAALRATAAMTEDAVSARFWSTRYELAQVMIDRGIARGELPEGVNPRAALEMLIAPLHFRVLIAKEPLPEDLPEQLADLVLEGLRAR
ncbi:TetR/AcrR family transcriptional regulator [Sciscionella sediminilitoris]|uniref:TetR/AcrR family transcriptional regulator n=1 Tax=Sciscionella sediminilitoris TaxID=1445613 RepID=UPI0004DF02BB|nr:TetR/AcrR family transcriptional regulator [Sciscionella sp. SE31]